MAPTDPPMLGANGKPLRRPVVYLDQSTLGDAFEGTIGVGPDLEAKAKLAGLIAEVASRGTLCVSATHLIELASWNPRENAIGMASWLDGLGPMWFQMEGASEAELEEEVGRRLGLEDAMPRRLLIHGTLTAAWREHTHVLSPEGTVQILRDPTIRGVIREAHGKIDGENPKTYSVSLFRRLQEDRASIPEGTTPEQVVGFTNGKLYRSFEIEARAKINARPIILFAPRPTDFEISQAVRDLLDEPAALPLNKVGPHLFREIGKKIVDSDPESNRFAKRYRSFLWDIRHALAAGVTDVFTCDGPVDDALGDFRTDRGLPRQISRKRCGPTLAAFVAELRRQCRNRA